MTGRLRFTRFRFLSFLLLLPAAVALSAQPVGAQLQLLGPPMRLNVNVGAVQGDPRVALRPDGQGLFLWESDAPDGSQGFIYRRPFKLGQLDQAAPETRIDPAGGDQQFSPTAGVLADGRFLAGWRAAGSPPEVQFLRPDGTADSGILPLGIFALTDFRTVPLAGGGFLAFSPMQQLEGRLFDNQGQAVTGSFPITGTQYGVNYIGLAPTADGGFLAGWGGIGFASSTLGAVRRFDAHGAELRETQIVSPTQFFNGITGLAEAPDGSWLAVWNADSPIQIPPTNFARVYLRRFAASGEPLTPTIAVAPEDTALFQHEASVTVDRSGHVLVVWTGGIGEGLGANPFARLFDLDGNLQSPILRLTEDDGDHAMGGVATDGNGRFLVTWSGPGPGDPTGVFARELGAGPCLADDTHLCLQGNRFRVHIDWTDPRTGATGKGHASPLTGDTGLFWFFSPANLEAAVKVLDGRPLNGHFWVYAGSLTDLDAEITVEDAQTGETKTYEKPAGQLAGIADISSFGPEAATAGAAAIAGAAAAGGDATTLSLDDSRFTVTVDWLDPASGLQGHGQARPLTSDTGAFSFFDPANVEMLVKVLDGRPVNGHFWVYYGTLSDLDLTLKVTDTTTGQSRTYHRPASTLTGGADTQAF
jgi:hypothetical protein